MSSLIITGLLYVASAPRGVLRVGGAPHSMSRSAVFFFLCYAGRSMWTGSTRRGKALLPPEVPSSCADMYYSILMVLLHSKKVRYVAKLQEDLSTNPNKNGWNVAVTGHSLGGGISTIVGSTLGVQSVAFSPPGFTMSRFKFETRFKEKNLTLVPKLRLAARYSVNFIPMHDMVPKADAHFGVVQHTICTHKSPLSCHSLELMACDLVNRCGDGANGTRFSHCKYKEADLNEMALDSIALQCEKSFGLGPFASPCLS